MTDENKKLTHGIFFQIKKDIKSLMKTLDSHTEVWRGELSNRDIDSVEIPFLIAKDEAPYSYFSNGTFKLEESENGGWTLEIKISNDKVDK